MAHTEKNKFDFTTSFGAAGDTGLEGDASDGFGVEAPSVPTGNVNNQFNAGGRLGDTPPFGPAGESGSEFDADSAGVPNPNMGEQTDMDMALEGNKFPRETGHDSLSPEEAQLT